MKDLYTFDESPQLAMETYESVRNSYADIFRELGLPYMVAAADSGNIGGSLSHEYHLPSDGGEDRLVSCQHCDFVANEEVAAIGPPDRERAAPLADHASPIAQGRGQEATEDTPKVADGDPCPKCQEGKVVVRKAIELAHTFLLGTRYSDAFQAKIDGRSVSQNNRSASVGGFKNVAQAPDSPSESSAPKGAPTKIPVQMGCYGIGISRILGAAAGSLMDRTGLNWPRAMAPHEVVVIPGPGNEPDAETVYDTLLNTQLFPATAEQASYPRHGADSIDAVDVVLDDRPHHTSWKLKDADLIGFPVIVVLGRAWKEKHTCEVQCRRLSNLREEVAVQDLPRFVASLLEKL
jgi:prolyl-tRNA synthetase